MPGDVSKGCEDVRHTCATSTAGVWPSKAATIRGVAPSGVSWFGGQPSRCTKSTQSGNGGYLQWDPVGVVAHTHTHIRAIDAQYKT